jgi:hypothetical protein
VRKYAQSCAVRTAAEKRVLALAKKGIAADKGRGSFDKWQVYGGVRDEMDARRVTMKRADQILTCAGYTTAAGVASMRLRYIGTMRKDQKKYRIR